MLPSPQAQATLSSKENHLRTTTITVKRASSALDATKAAYQSINSRVAGRSNKANPPPQPVLNPQDCGKALHSFKVLTECPIVIVLLYQLYNTTPQDGVKKLLPDFVPLAMSVLAYAPGLKTTVPEAIRDLHAEFIGAQVKTLSFIAYILNKKLHDYFTPYKEQLPAFVLQLLHSAPSNCAQVGWQSPLVVMAVC